MGSADQATRPLSPRAGGVTATPGDGAGQAKHQLQANGWVEDVGCPSTALGGEHESKGGGEQHVEKKKQSEAQRRKRKKKTAAGTDADGGQKTDTRVTHFLAVQVCVFLSYVGWSLQL